MKLRFRIKIFQLDAENKKINNKTILKNLKLKNIQFYLLLQKFFRRNFLKFFKAVF